MQSEIPDDVMKAARASTVAYFNSFGAYAEADAVSNKDRDHWGEVQSAAWAIMAERERCKAALSAAEPSVAVKAPFEFDRYINGKLMAEGVRVERVDTLEKAMSVAVKIASRGPNGERPVLVLRTTLTAQVQDVAGTPLREIFERWRDGYGFNEDSDEDVDLLERASAAAPAKHEGEK